MRKGAESGQWGLAGNGQKILGPSKWQGTPAFKTLGPSCCGGHNLVLACYFLVAHPVVVSWKFGASTVFDRFFRRS
jgi:hypothetical protein